MKLPSKGALCGDTRYMVNPRKVGQVMWARDDHGEMVPLDLHSRISESDAKILNRIFNALTTFRKVTPALSLIVNAEWTDFKTIRPYLILSMEGRSEARSMKTDGSWEEFWSAMN